MAGFFVDTTSYHSESEPFIALFVELLPLNCKVIFYSRCLGDVQSILAQVLELWGKWKPNSIFYVLQLYLQCCRLYRCKYVYADHQFSSTIVLVQLLMTAGGLYSADDFYVLDSKLVVMETTIDNYNKSLYLGSSKIHDMMSHICISI